MTFDAPRSAPDVDTLLRDPALFSIGVTGLPLRDYQLEIARAVLDSVLERRGLTFAVLMSRQAGKNETAAQLEALLLLLFEQRGGWLVKASPTFKPQSLHSMLRLEARLDNPSASGRWRRERGCIVRLGNARALFLSAHPSASVVGATASILLEADEAQDIAEEKWLKEFRPMAASTNATTVLWGTAWTPDTLLARTAAALAEQEEQDGIRRVFRISWREVAAEVPAYGAYVQGEIARLGATHPLVRTQYALEELDAAAGLFTPARQALMRGDHAPHSEKHEYAMYALCVDVAGEDPGGGIEPEGEGRDCTACTLFEVRLVDEGEPLEGRPRYFVVGRWWWRGLPQAELYTRLTDLVHEWSPRHIVVDATGLGAGVASFLQRKHGSRVRPFTFTAASKSDLGWAFLGICDTGRFKDHAPANCPVQDEFWRQVAAAEAEPVVGPGRRLRWGVRRGHDDLLVSAALCADLEQASWSRGESVIIPPWYPIEENDRSPF